VGPGKRWGLARDQPPSDNQQAAAKQLDASILRRAADNLPGSVVLMTTRYGTPRRRIYLDLGTARTAVARARGKGVHAEMVLADLTPVQAADLDIGGGDQE
jgi:hypothetical protein